MSKTEKIGECEMKKKQKGEVKWKVCVKEFLISHINKTIDLKKNLPYTTECTQKLK